MNGQVQRDRAGERAACAIRAEVQHKQRTGCEVFCAWACRVASPADFSWPSLDSPFVHS